MPFKTNTLLRACLLACLVFLSYNLLAQKTTVAGRVVNNADKQPVVGATVQVKGTKTATVTSMDGTFSIDVTGSSAVLVISSIGYDRQEIPVSGRSKVGDIGLLISTSSLNEIVVTGYSAQKKKDITGSVAVINVNNMKAVPSGTAEALLQGQASGVTVINSGVPGGGSTVRIRGITSIGSNDPLVLIDGTPGSLHDLNINDVESIQVLKDAGAAAIYGVRGSNGVLIVTTKKGRPGKARITYDGFYGTQRPLSGNVFNIATPQETANAYWLEYQNDGLTPAHPQWGNGAQPVLPDYITPSAGKTGDPLTDPSTYKLYTNQITKINKSGTDWFHEVFKPASIQSHTVSASGGGEKSAYYFSVGYFNQQGTAIETYLKRYSARINTVFNVKDHIRIGENAYVLYRQAPGFTNQNEGNPVSYTYRESPAIPVYDIMGNYAGTNSKGFGNPQNPVANSKRTHYNLNNNWQMNGNVFAEVDFLKHFTARTSFGGNVENIYTTSFSYTAYENAENNTNPNAYVENSIYKSSWTWTNTLKYTNVFAEKHSVSVLGGIEAIQSNARGLTGRRGPYYLTNPNNLTVDPNLWTIDFGPPNGQTNSSTVFNTGYPTQSALYSLFGRLEYSFNDKYIISATVRRDGSSILDVDHRFGVFPSFTAGWRISREDFMKDITWINDLKIRGGWGKLGFIPTNVPTTNAFNLFSQGAANSYYDINGTSNSSVLGIYNSQLGNKLATWEGDKVTNIGFDATILQNKLDLSVEWYNKAVDGLFFQAALPVTNSGGAKPPFINSGNISNKGIDASATYHGTVQKDFKFDVGVTFTTYRNKVESLPPGIKYYDRASSGSTRIGAFTRLQTGQPIGEFFGYKVIGLFQDAADVAKSPKQDAAAPGRFKYADVNGSGTVNDSDRTFFGNPNPKWSAGFTLNASYKNFDFSMFLYANVGNDVINYVKYWTDFPQVFDAAISKTAVYGSAKLVNSAGQPTNINDPTARVANPGAKTPALERSANFSNTVTFNSYYMEKGSYLRCKSMMLGYTVPSATLKRFGIDRLRVYVQAVNLFTITKYTGLDPELQGSTLSDNSNFGIDQGNYPGNQRNYNVGVNLSF